MGISFKNFKEIEKLEKIEDKHRAWLKDYEGLHFSIAKDKEDLIFWQKEKDKYIYLDKLWVGWFCKDFKGNFLYAHNINKIQRHKKRLVIEFDDDNAKENLEIVYNKLKENNWGFIKSTHNSEKSDYLWVEFTRELTEEEAESFLNWIQPENSEIDLNFASDNRRYPVLFAEHWKYKIRELPVEYFEGEQIDYDKLGIKIKKIVKTTNISFGNDYITSIKKEDLPKKVLTCLILKKRSDATELLVHNFLKENKIYTTRDDEKSEIWIYKDGIFISEGKTYIKQYCRDVLGKAFTGYICNEVISKIEADTYINQEDFFKEEDKNLVAVQNGILNVRTKNLLPFNPKYRFFNKLPMNYSPKATCKSIMNFFESTLKDKEEINVIQELFGFLIYREYFLEKAFMFLGSGRNGKGKTIDLMKRFLGLDNCSEISLEDLERDLFSLGELFKKMANLSGDLSKTALKNTGNFKKLTGRDLISGARKFKTRVNYENYAKMVFACNELPITYDITLAFFNRWIILDFPFTFLNQDEINKIPENERTNIKLQDPEIINKIATKEELEGLLNWALEGLERLFKNKSFSFSPSTNETERKWFRKSDSFQAFIMDCIEEDYEGFITKSDLRTEYHKYCKIHKLKSSSDKTLKYILQTNLGANEERKHFEENQVAVWVGIKFKPQNQRKSAQNPPSEVREVREGIVFGTDRKVKNSPLAEKTLPSPATLTSSPFDKFKKPTKFTSEMVEKSGIDPELIKKTMKEIEDENKPEIVSKIKKEEPRDDKKDFYNKLNSFGF